jgi:hypothetical protein
MDNQILQHQPFVVKIKLEGAGNAKLGQNPSLQLPPDFELYDTKAESVFLKNGTSVREIQYFIIAKKSGKITLPAQSWFYLNPELKPLVYAQVQFAEINMDVKPSNLPSPAKENTEDTLNIKNKILLSEFSEHSKLPSRMSLMLSAVISLLAICLLVWKFRLEWGFGEKKKSLQYFVKKRLEIIEDYAKQEKIKSVGAGLVNLQSYILNQVSGQLGSDTKSALLNSPPSVRREMASSIEKNMEVFQFMCFAPEEALASYKSKPALFEVINNAKQIFYKTLDLGFGEREVES